MKSQPLWNALIETDRRLADTDGSTDTLLSVSKDRGVLRYDELFPERAIRAENHDHYKFVEPGFIVLNKMSAATGAVGVATESGVVSPDYAVFIPRDGNNSKFIGYVLGSTDFCKNRVAPTLRGIGTGDATSVRTPRVGMREYLSLHIPFPSQETQERIADYLDRETAEIDAAVADLDRYVELLEKRRLLTVDEVLHSSDLAVSGWPEMPLKLIIQERFVGDWGGEPGTADVDSVCVRVADFDRPTNTVNDQVPTTRSYSREKYEAKRLRHHDILVERSGGGEKTPVGSAMLYTGGNEALCANFIEVVRLKEDQLPEYWVHVLRREYMGRNTMRFVKQTTGIQNLDPQGFYDQKFRVPSFNEQRDLARELNSKTTEIDSLITESTKLRDLLLKRRSVLITDVVTGRKQV